MKVVFRCFSQLNLNPKVKWVSQGSSSLDADGFLILTPNSQFAETLNSLKNFLEQKYDLGFRVIFHRFQRIFARIQTKLLVAKCNQNTASEIFLYYFYSIFGVVLVHRDSPWTGLQSSPWTLSVVVVCRLDISVFRLPPREQSPGIEILSISDSDLTIWILINNHNSVKYQSYSKDISDVTYCY